MILKYLISFLLLIGCLLATDTNVVAWEGEPGPGGRNEVAIGTSENVRCQIQC